MPLDTRLDGDPGSLHVGAQWLRTRLGFEVDGGATSLRSASAEARDGWQGAAGTRFADRMAQAADRTDALRAQIDATAATFSRYGELLATAQGSMATARAIAAANGLLIAGPMILDPIPPPVPSPAAMVLFERQVSGFQMAAQQVATARAQMVTAHAIAEARQGQAAATPPLRPADVIGPR
ncbi:hypothetical protein GCM10009828_056020 [Actinoplanes couchii]|uniref:PPE family domain-containing protein n=2 Tax=Actinoplanes couchii TaxID=403638 RepID=A0ABQ3X1C5_9ACTN|nr:hypothetical protein Aco03nite_007370 [Actinoplanes couchii]